MLGAALLCGCASAWVTPTPPTTASAPLTESVSRLPTVAPAATAEPPTAGEERDLSETWPTPTPMLATLTITDAPVQYWSDPNDVSGLVREGAHLWAATSDGVVRWDTAGRHRLYSPDDGLASLAIRGIALDGDGHLWVGYADHEAWSEYDGETWHTYSSREDAVVARYEALLAAREFDPRLWSSRTDSHWLWLPVGDGRIAAYDGEKWRTYGEYAGITRHTWLVVISEAGRVWAIGRGVSTAEEGQRWWNDHNLFSEIGERNQISDVTLDAQGGLWLAYAGLRGRNGGVCRLNEEATRWQGYLNEVNPAIPREVHGVVVDPDGTRWLCGEGGITVQRPGRPWRRLPLGDLDVRTFLRDPEGHLWLGTAQGIWRAKEDGSDLQGPWRVPSPIMGRQVIALARDVLGQTYLGMPYGVSTVDTSGKTGILTTEEALCLATGPTGQVWVGTANGLYAVDADSSTLSRKLDGGVIALAVDSSNTPWACTETGDLIKLEDAGKRVIANVHALSGLLPRNMVIDSQGTAWFSMEEGLGRLVPDDDFDLFTVEDGLLSADVRAVALGPDDAIWMATAKGLVRRLPSGRWTRFTVESTEGGLRSMEMWGIAVDAEGTLWMATTAGLSSRTPETDWSYIDIPDARVVLPASAGAIWVGTPNGLYRVQRAAMTPVP